MDIVKANIKHNLKLDNYFPNENICILDIETTGLNKFKDAIYLIGILYFSTEDESWVLDQYFADDLNEEKEMLELVLSNIVEYDRIISYNGDFFDLPFIKQRLKHYKLSDSLKTIKSFDLYQYIRKYRFLFDLPDLKLKTIERELGFIREDKYSGLDCIDFYFDYIKSNNSILKERILKHNFDDLVHMLDIIPIIDLIDNKRSLYVDFANSNRKFSIEKIQVSNDLLKIEGTIKPPLENNIKYYDKNFNFLTEDRNSFSLSLEFSLGLISPKEKCKYINLDEFSILGKLRNSEDLKVASNIFILAIEKKYCIDNIRNLINEILKSLAN